MAKTKRFDNFSGYRLTYLQPVFGVGQNWRNYFAPAAYYLS